MKVSSFKTLQLKDPRTAMIFDLTERFPRGPKAKLRAKHYKAKDDWDRNLHVPTSDDLIGGELGYDLFELYDLCKENWWVSDLECLTVDIKDCAMGSQVYNYETRDYEKQWSLFKRGPQITRRLRRLESRLRLVRKLVEEASNANLYAVRVGNLNQNVSMFGDSEEHVKMQFDLLLKGGFEAAADTVLMSRGGGYYGDGPDECSFNARFTGPSHGPHEIMAANQTFTTAMQAKKTEMLNKIEDLKKAITACDDLCQLVDMFTINSCAQQFGDSDEEKS
tara:strand:+ start:1240 stop:2073 length:834 start_codon:yes stop_codon:yes gene_type:complete